MDQPIIDIITIKAFILHESTKTGEILKYGVPCPEFLCDFKTNYYIFYLDSFSLDSFTLHNLCYHRELYSKAYLYFLENLNVNLDLKPRMVDLYKFI